MSSLPGRAVPDAGFPGADKLVHVVVYAVLGGLCARPLRRTPWGQQRPWTSIAAATAVATMYGVTDEIHQMFVPQRAADAWDLAADAVGGVVGATLGAQPRRRRAKVSGATATRDGPHG